MKYVKFSDNEPFYFERHNYAGEPDDIVFPEHYHNFFEIYYIENGDCDYFIDNKSYKLIPGDLVLIPEGIIHNTLYIKNKPSRILINCTRKYIPSSVLSLFSKRKYLYRNPEIKDTLHKLLNTIGEEYKSSDEYSDDVIRCHMELFFFLMARNKNHYTDSLSQSSFIEKALTFILKNLSSDISLSEIAKRFSVSPEHFSRRFKKEIGMNFNEYVSKLRLTKAESLLKQEKRIPIAEIAAECGFSDSNYFSVKFKKRYGVSPKTMQTKK